VTSWKSPSNVPHKIHVIYSPKKESVHAKKEPYKKDMNVSFIPWKHNESTDQSICDQHRKFLHNVNDRKASHKSFYAQGFILLCEFSNSPRATDAFSQTYSISVSIKAIFMKNACFVFNSIYSCTLPFFTLPNCFVRKLD
jgi:hypothetical protein